MYNVQCVQSVGYSKFRYSSSWGFKMWRFKIWGFKIWVFKLWVIKVRGFKIKGIQNLGIQNHGESKSGDSKSGDSKSRGFKIWGINGSVPLGGLNESPAINEAGAAFTAQVNMFANNLTRWDLFVEDVQVLEIYLYSILELGAKFGHMHCFWAY